MRDSCTGQSQLLEVTGPSGRTEYKMQSLAVLSPILHIGRPESTAVGA